MRMWRLCLLWLSRSMLRVLASGQTLPNVRANTCLLAREPVALHQASVNPGESRWGYRARKLPFA